MDLQKRRVLFMDSALPDEISFALDRGYQGVTTNPSLTAKVPKGDESKAPMERYVSHMNKLADLCSNYRQNDGSIPSLSVEVFSLDPKEMISQARHLKKEIPYENLAIKIPISYNSTDFTPVIKTLADEGIDVNATCGFSASQLELAAQAGARYVSLFYNRLIDHHNSLNRPEKLEDTHDAQMVNGKDFALEELRKTRKYLDNNPSLNAEIILGSIRYPQDIVEGWENGADIVTSGFKVHPGLVFHPATDKSVKGFDDDIQKWLK
jgi:transaldolase